MSQRTPKKPHNQMWEEAQRVAHSARFYDVNPYRSAQKESHPFSPNNPSNPYARKPEGVSERKQPVKS